MGCNIASLESRPRKSIARRVVLFFNASKFSHMISLTFLINLSTGKEIMNAFLGLKFLHFSLLDYTKFFISGGSRICRLGGSGVVLLKQGAVDPIRRRKWMRTSVYGHYGGRHYRGPLGAQSLNRGEGTGPLAPYEDACVLYHFVYTRGDHSATVTA